MPSHPTLAAVASATRLISPFTIDLTVRYGIFLRSDCWRNRLLVAHELVHTLQYERLGGFEAFLRPYLIECLIRPGYPYGAMEKEADVVSKTICGSQNRA